jgi:hypothetical protein
MAPLLEEVGASVPHNVGEQLTLASGRSRLQVTPAFAASFVTVAVNCCVVVATTVCTCGSVSTTMAGTVIDALATALELETDVAVAVTCKSPSGAAGAV